MGIEPKHALMVGDDPRDVEAGQRAGSLTAVAYYGYAAGCDEAMFNGAVPINSPLEILSLL